MPWESGKRTHPGYSHGNGTIRRRNHAGGGSVAIVFDVVPSPLPLRTKSCPLLTVKPASIHRGGPVGLPTSNSSAAPGLKFSPVSSAGHQRSVHGSAILPHIPSLPESRSTVPHRSEPHRSSYERRWPHRRSSRGPEDLKDAEQHSVYNYLSPSSSPPRLSQNIASPSNSHNNASSRSTSESHSDRRRSNRSPSMTSTLAPAAHTRRGGALKDGGGAGSGLPSEPRGANAPCGITFLA